MKSIRILSLFIFIILILLWEFLLDSKSWIPNPSEVYLAFLELLKNGVLVESIFASLHFLYRQKVLAKREQEKMLCII